MPWFSVSQGPRFPVLQNFILVAIAARGPSWNIWNFAESSCRWLLVFLVTWYLFRTASELTLTRPWVSPVRGPLVQCCFFLIFLWLCLALLLEFLLGAFAPAPRLRVEPSLVHQGWFFVGVWGCGLAAPWHFNPRQQHRPIKAGSIPLPCYVAFAERQSFQNVLQMDSTWQDLSSSSLVRHCVPLQIALRDLPGEAGVLYFDASVKTSLSSCRYNPGIKG